MSTPAERGAATARQARARLAGITADLSALATEFATLAGRADVHGMAKASTMLRHMQRELMYVVQSGDPVIGAVHAADTGQENTP